MKSYKNITIAAIIIPLAFAIMAQGMGESREQAKLTFTNYFKEREIAEKMIAPWRSNNINVHTATLESMIIKDKEEQYSHSIYSSIFQAQPIEKKIIKILCKDSCFDIISGCFCVQRSYHVHCTYNGMLFKKIYSTQPQNSRFDIRTTGVSNIDIMQKAPCIVPELFIKGYQEEIIEICRQQDVPGLKTRHALWSPDFSHVAFVVMEESDKDDQIIVMTPKKDHSISLTKLADLYYYFK
jgi:hypothetical protein